MRREKEMVSDWVVCRPHFVGIKWSIKFRLHNFLFWMEFLLIHTLISREKKKSFSPSILTRIGNKIREKKNVVDEFLNNFSLLISFIFLVHRFLCSRRKRFIYNFKPRLIAAFPGSYQWIIDGSRNWSIRFYDANRQMKKPPCKCVREHN